MGRAETSLSDLPETANLPDRRRKLVLVSRALGYISCLALFYSFAIALKRSPSSFSALEVLPFSFGLHGQGFWTRDEVCKPPSANIFATSPPRSNNGLIAKASKDIDQYLAKRTAKSDIDSLAIAVVTPGGIVFERGYGVLKANESNVEDQKPVDSNSIYRLASISKMFTALETLILRERGVLQW